VPYGMVVLSVTGTVSKNSRAKCLNYSKTAILDVDGQPLRSLVECVSLTDIWRPWQGLAVICNSRPSPIRPCRAWLSKQN